ncbi:hypothetical protein ACFOWE_23170 [Planomonospora corallina]|uniref:Uncharacterized protein n=1 Tax=Planomonospora corallina TaxID=1806052 RepID=A0ABV8IDW7_9ACTN
MADGHLVVGLPPGRRVRLPLTGPGRATTLLLYGHPGPYGTVYGLAVLDDEGQVMLDSPGARPRHPVETTAAQAGLAFVFRLYGTAEEARRALARSVPGRDTDVTRPGLSVPGHPETPGGFARPEAPGTPGARRPGPPGTAWQGPPPGPWSGPPPVCAGLRPVAGATKGAPFPATVLSWDGDTLVALDPPAGRTVRITPAALYHYRYPVTVTDSRWQEKKRVFTGIALLDAAGLVLLDLPGEWRVPDVAAFAAYRGLPIVDALALPPERVRATLAGRAPGWTRLTGRPAPRFSRGKKVAIAGAGTAGLLVMAYLSSVGGWAAWRGLSTLGWVLLDAVDAKWLAVFFSPLILVLAPVRRALHLRRARRASVLGPPGGPFLTVRDGRLHIRQVPQAVPSDLMTGPWPGTAAVLLVYRHENLRGLFVLSGTGVPLHHLPGPWHPEAVHRFAVRHGLACEVRALSRGEYPALALRAVDASP